MQGVAPEAAESIEAPAVETSSHQQTTAHQLPTYRLSKKQPTQQKPTTLVALVTTGVAATSISYFAYTLWSEPEAQETQEQIDAEQSRREARILFAPDDDSLFTPESEVSQTLSVEAQTVSPIDGRPHPRLTDH